MNTLKTLLTHIYNNFTYIIFFLFISLCVFTYRLNREYKEYVVASTKENEQSVKLAYKKACYDTTYRLCYVDAECSIVPLEILYSKCERD